MDNMKSEKNNSRIIRAMNAVEKIGNALPNPATLFLLLTILVMVISSIAAYFGVSVTYEAVDIATGQLANKTVSAVNLLSGPGIRHIFTTIVSNFTSFFPLGPVFVIILGVGVAEGTGFMEAIMRKLAKHTPKQAVTAMVIFLGIISNVASSTGYIVLVPLGAIIFMSVGRHPIAGLAAAFAGVSGGWSANLLIGTNDPVFAGISTEAARTLDPNYLVLPTANWYFMIASTFMIVLVGTLITEKLVEPKLGKYVSEEEIIVEDITGDEKRGMRFALVGFLIYLAIILWMVVPSNGILRNPDTGGIISSPFMTSIIFIIMLMFLIPGIFYGIGAKVIQSDKDVVKLMEKAIASISGFLVLIFFAAQFVSLFNYSNLGIIISVNGAAFLERIGFNGIPLIIAFIIVTAFINIFIAVDSAKWAIMAPIFVPLFMKLGISPELTQAAYRVGDSSTNIIAPLMPFFPLIVAFFQKYDKESGIGTVISTMLPYTLGILLAWIVMIVIWILIGLPLGVAAPLFYPG